MANFARKKMRRYSVSDEVWNKISDLFPTRGGKPDNRLFFDAVYWIAKSGAPWRDLPERFGKWNTVYVRFNRLTRTNLWGKVFERFSDGDLRQLIIDSTTVKAAPKAGGALKKAGRRKPWAAPVED